MRNLTTTSIRSYTAQDDRGGFPPLWQKSATPRISRKRREVQPAGGTFLAVCDAPATARYGTDGLAPRLVRDTKMRRCTLLVVFFVLPFCRVMQQEWRIRSTKAASHPVFCTTSRDKACVFSTLRGVADVSACFCVGLHPRAFPNPKYHL